jgi:hypothetical protein
MWLSLINDDCLGRWLQLGERVYCSVSEHNTLSQHVNSWLWLASLLYPACPITKSYCIEEMSNFRVSSEKLRWEGGFVMVYDHSANKIPKVTKPRSDGTHLFPRAVPRFMHSSFRNVLTRLFLQIKHKWNGKPQHSYRSCLLLDNTDFGSQTGATTLNYVSTVLLGPSREILR